MFFEKDNLELKLINSSSPKRISNKIPTESMLCLKYYFGTQEICINYVRLMYTVLKQYQFMKSQS